MAGHSKWANIRHKKSKVDAQRGKAYTKLIRAIVAAVRQSGPDLDSNPSLRLAVDRAKQRNMPNDKIKKAIDKASGQGDADNVEAIRYEGYGPNGVAVMVDCLTDNRNRAVAEVRHAFSKRGGNLGTTGSVGYLFQQVGTIVVDLGPDPTSLDALMELALEHGANDLSEEGDDTVVITTEPSDLMTVCDAVRDAGYSITSTELAWVADTTVTLDQGSAETLLALQDALDNLDDVQAVHTNADIADDVFERLNA